MAGAFSSGTTDKVHDTGTGILERALQQASRNTQSHTGTAQGTLIVCNRPGVVLQLFEDAGDLELGLLNRQEEARSGRASWLLLRGSRANTVGEAQHFLYLLGCVVLVTSEDIRLGTLGVAEFMHLSL